MKLQTFILSTCLLIAGNFTFDLGNKILMDDSKQSSRTMNCGAFVNFVNQTSSDLTILFKSEITSIQSVTIPANSSVNMGNYSSSHGLQWSFRILGGLNGSIASIETTQGVSDCTTTTTEDRFYILENPITNGCGTVYDFIFADYNQCN